MTLLSTRRILQVSVTLLLLASIHTVQAQDHYIRAHGDSLIIVEPGIGSDPFGFGANPMNDLVAKYKPGQIQREPMLSRQTPHQIDTAIRFVCGRDIFIVYKKSATENTLIHADIESDRFKTKHGIIVGMHKADVIRILSRYTITSIPKYLILKSSTGKESVGYAFKDDVLIWLEYIGDF